MGLINMNDSLTLNKTDEILHVIFDYTGRGDDELTIKRGSIVEVLSKDEKISGSEGWWAGRVLDTDSVGIFPANFVAVSEPNLRIIDYKDLSIRDLIGIGGFGQVHSGKFGDVDVAIKSAKSLASFSTFDHPSQSHDDDTYRTLIESLLREARLFSILTHRNIIQLFGVSPSPQTTNLYLVMEYARGGALSNLFQQRKSGLYPRVFVQYAKQIADGMKYLHDEASEHIIHRDLKCSNILILEAVKNVLDEQELITKTLKITDFGLAKKQVQSSSMSTAGTFAWMSPECIRNNEFSTKSDVWSFGVLLWECLTGEIPYKGFDQMQVAFGIATQKYSLPIPSTCPEEFSKLMKDCWEIVPQKRPTFRELYDEINAIADAYSTDGDLTCSETDEGSFSSLQEDWRKEIQEIFDELKTKEQEIRDREQAMLQMTLDQNHQRMQLEKWENDLHEREMHIIECELKLLMASKTNPQERTPRIQKRSGNFMRALLNATLNGTSSLSSTTATHIIGHPTNFRHLICVSKENNMLQQHHHPSLDYGSSSTLPINGIRSPPLPKSTSVSSTLPANSKIHTSSPTIPHTSKSTPTTPNLNRLRTLTFHFADDGQDSPSDKSSRSSTTSQSKSSLQRSTWRKSKAEKRKHKNRPGEPKWYLEPIASNNTTDSPPPTTDQSTAKIDCSEPSDCSTPSDLSLTRAIFEVNSLLLAIGLGKNTPAPSLLSTPSSTSSTSIATPKASVQSPNLRSTSGINKQHVSSSVNSTPSTQSKKQHKRTSSSPIKHTIQQTNDSPQTSYRARPFYSSVRPNSLTLSSIPPPPPSSSVALAALSSQNSQSNPELMHRHFSHSSQSTAITSTPEEDEDFTDDDDDYSDNFYSAQSSKLSTPMVQPLPVASNSHILDIETDEQKKHQTKVLPPEVDTAKVHISRDILERDFLS